MTNTPSKPGKGTTSQPPVPAERVLGREPLQYKKRFYTAVAVVPAPEGFAVTLDGRGTRTPRKLPLVVASQPLAQAIADEWAAQTENILPTTMPLTTLACTAIDAVAERRDDVASEIGNYALSDLLCYRAGDPAALAELHRTKWDPIVAWATAELGVPIRTTAGLMHVTQAPEVKTAVLAQLAPLDPMRLAAMHVLTTITGSALLALAVLKRHIDLDTAWTLAHIDEDWQIAKWGTDAEAETRRRARHITAIAAARAIALLS